MDGARSRKIRSEDGGDQRSTPHAVTDHLTETAFRRVFGIHVRGIDVARHDSKKCDVLFGQRALERCAVTDLDFVEQAILYKAHDQAPDPLLVAEVGCLASGIGGTYAYQ